MLPQLKLAVWGGSILIALHLLAEYGLYAMIRFDTFTTAIFDQFQSTFNGPAANMLAGEGDKRHTEREGGHRQWK